MIVEHPKEEQIIIYLRKGFFESNSKFEYKEIDINRSKIGFK